MSKHTTDAPLRRCPKCGESKPATTKFFSRDARRKSGLRCWCKKCANAYRAAWYATHANEVRASINAYHAIHADEHNAYQAAYRAANRDKTRTIQSRREARKRALPATLTHLEWRRCLEYWNSRCAVCGRPQGLWHKLAQDHWIPLSSPECPGTVASNIVPLCHGENGCNNKKSTSDPHDWLLRTFGKRKAARIERRIREYFDSLSVD